MKTPNNHIIPIPRSGAIFMKIIVAFVTIFIVHTSAICAEPVLVHNGFITVQKPLELTDQERRTNFNC